jgi:hypothetical protein
MLPYEIRSQMYKLALTGASLTDADLTDANLIGANLTDADLTDADLDISSGIPFHCGSFGIICDVRLAAQMAYHLCRLDCSDPAYLEALPALAKLANQSHLVKECGRIGEPKEKVTP